MNEMNSDPTPTPLNKYISAYSENLLCVKNMINDLVSLYQNVCDKAFAWITIVRERFFWNTNEIGQLETKWH